MQAGPPAHGRPSPARAGHAIGSRSPHLQRWPRWARRRAACRGLSARARPLTRGRAAEACHRRQLHRREHSCARRRAMPPRQRGWSNHVLERVPMRGALSAAACAATPGADARHRSSWSLEATSAPRAVRRSASPPAQPPLGPGLCPSANGRWAQVQARPARADPSGWAHRTPGTAPARGGGHPRRSTKRRRVRGQRLRGLARRACGNTAVRGPSWPPCRPRRHTEWWHSTLCSPWVRPSRPRRSGTPLRIAAGRQLSPIQPPPSPKAQAASRQQVQLAIL